MINTTHDPFRAAQARAQDLFAYNNNQLSATTKFPDDVLALGCQSYLNYQANGIYKYPELESLIVGAEARDMAATIRSYYGRKFTEAVLYGYSLSDFRRKMSQFLYGKIELNNNDLGLAYRIPYFYQEDIDTDWVHENTQPIALVPELARVTTNSLELTPLRRSLRSQRSGDIIRFWFRTDDGHPALFKVQAANPLLPLMDSLFKQSKISIVAACKIVSMSGQNYSNTRFHVELFNLRLS